MFVYDENGLLTGYNHLAGNWYHSFHGCPDEAVCEAVEQAMVTWARAQSGQMRRRLDAGKCSQLG
jgi:hypothetical protein